MPFINHVYNHAVGGGIEVINEIHKNDRYFSGKKPQRHRQADIIPVGQRDRKNQKYDWQPSTPHKRPAAEEKHNRGKSCNHSYRLKIADVEMNRIEGVKDDAANHKKQTEIVGPGLKSQDFGFALIDKI